MIWLLFACRHKEEEWTPPAFAGDGLPASADTEHPHPSFGNTADSGDTAVIDTDVVELPEYTIVDALFAWDDYYDLPFAYVVLLTEPITCADLMQPGFSPNGVYYVLYPTQVEHFDFNGHYETCGEMPCAYSYYVAGGDYGYLDGVIDVSEYSQHYVTISWTDAISQGAGMPIYNCGRMADWFYYGYGP